MATTTINFAKLVGQYDSLAAAIIFAILYVPLAVRFVFSLIRERTRILFVLTLFCLIRITSFTIRAVLVGSEGAGENEGLFIADQVLSSIGFVGLLLSAHGLVVNRLELDNSEPSSPISRITRNRRLFRLLTTAAAVLGIVGINYLTSTDASQRSTGETLKKVGIILFLVLTVNVAYLTSTLIFGELSGSVRPTKRPTYSPSFGHSYGSYILGLIAFFMLLRELFLVATISSSTTQNAEKFWYPFVALPEVLCVMLFAIPGVIPPRAETGEAVTV
ncbi:hypothetical protein VKT23_009847 [Stygiomarasmius scandens]|uniref:DUF7702 domain-containing protein n=1 Tax=Marasmiellus scandens TaxID=2682957 RepID=A0ABR1JHL3_9AGAR